MNDVARGDVVHAVGFLLANLLVHAFLALLLPGFRVDGPGRRHGPPAGGFARIDDVAVGRDGRRVNRRIEHRGAVRLEPLERLLRQRHGLDVAVVVRHDVLAARRVERRDDAGKISSLLGPKDAHAAVDRVVARVLRGDVRSLLCFCFFFRVVLLRERKRALDALARGLLGRERHGALASHLFGVAARHVLGDGLQLRARRRQVHLKLFVDVPLLFSTRAILLAARLALRERSALRLAQKRRRRTSGSFRVPVPVGARRDRERVCRRGIDRVVPFLRVENRTTLVAVLGAKEVLGAAFVRRTLVVFVPRAVAERAGSRRRVITRRVARRLERGERPPRGAPRVPALGFCDSLRRARPGLVHDAQARQPPPALGCGKSRNDVVRLLLLKGSLSVVSFFVQRLVPLRARPGEPKRAHQEPQRELLHRPRRLGLPPGIRRGNARRRVKREFVFFRIRRRLLLLGCVLGARSAALAARDVDAHLVQPLPDLDAHRPVRAHHRDARAPVLALLHPAVALERRGGQHVALAHPAHGDAVLQRAVAHAPEHRAARQEHAGHAAAAHGNSRRRLAARQRRGHRARRALRAVRIIVRLLVRLAHRLRRETGNLAARKVLLDAQRRAATTRLLLRLAHRRDDGRAARTRRRPAFRLLLPSLHFTVFINDLFLLLPVDHGAARARLGLLGGVRDAPRAHGGVVRPLLRERAAPLLEGRRSVERAHPPLSWARVALRDVPRDPAPLPARLGLAPDRREGVEGRGGRRRGRRRRRFLLRCLRLDEFLRLLLRRRRPRRRIRRQTRGDARVSPLLRLP